MSASCYCQETRRRVATCRQRDTALHWAAFKGHAEVVQALLQAGANPVGSSAHLEPCAGVMLHLCEAASIKALQRSLGHALPRSRCLMNVLCN